MLVIDSWVPVINQLFGLKQGRKRPLDMPERKVERREEERETPSKKHSDDGNT